MEFGRSRHLRRHRFSEHNRIYLLTAVTHHRAPLMQDWRIGRLLVQQMRQAEIEERVMSVAWVVMPDHLHWLVQLRQGTLAQLMQRVKSLSARHINAALMRDSTVWQKGYHDQCVREESAIRPLARYVVYNPVRAGIVERIGDYPLWDACWL